MDEELNENVMINTDKWSINLRHPGGMGKRPMSYPGHCVTLNFKLFSSKEKLKSDFT